MKGSSLDGNVCLNEEVSEDLKTTLSAFTIRLTEKMTERERRLLSESVNGIIVSSSYSQNNRSLLLLFSYL